MIPRTFPSSVASNGSAQMIVYFLPSVSGLTRWVDYIPVQYTTASTSTTENTYNQNGYIPVASLSSISGLTPFKEYVPVYLDSSATDVWKVNITGFIPVGIAGVGGIPYALFAAGEQGWVYDPSNLASLFQDAAGTTPVTAMEQPVGLQLDLSGRGNHRRQTTSANRPVVSARVNLLTKTEQFDDAVWTRTSATIIATNTVSPIGISNAFTINYASTGTLRLTTPVSWVSGQTGTALIFVKKPSSGAASNVRISTNNGSAWNTGIGVKVALTDVWQPLLVSGILQTGSSAVQLHIGTFAPDGTNDATCVGSVDVWGADLRPANIGVNLPAYQRVNTSTDYDTAGFPIYIKANGSNQFMVSNAIDFTATDKMTVWVGVRKLSDATGFSRFCEFGDVIASNGSFSFNAPANTTSPSYEIALRGSQTTAFVATTFAAPITSVAAIQYDIAKATRAEEIIPRINTIQPTLAGSGSADAGTGNFGNYAAYHYARAGTSLFFGGHDYGSICRGAASSAAQITAAEGWINQRTKAY